MKEEERTLLRNARTGAAIESAAARLPKGWVVSIEIESESAWVSLSDEYGDDIETDGSEELSDEINGAVEIAIIRAARRQGDDIKKEPSSTLLPEAVLHEPGETNE